MVRNNETKNLRVWMDGEPVGTWTVEHGYGLYRKEKTLYVE